MKADIYTATTTQDAVVGKVTFTWALEKTISCSAKASMSRTSMGEGSFLKPGGVNEYRDFVKLRTSAAIPIGRRVKNIRNNAGVIWTEKDDLSENPTPTTFEIRGISPILGLSGEVLCFEMTLARIDVQ